MPMKKFADWTLEAKLALLAVIVGMLAIVVAILIAVAQFPPVTEWLRSVLTDDCTQSMDLAKFLRVCP